jgi:hypothetical protein
MSASRFFKLADVAEILNTSASQAYALVRSGPPILIAVRSS